VLAVAVMDLFCHRVGAIRTSAYAGASRV